MPSNLMLHAVSAALVIMLLYYVHKKIIFIDSDSIKGSLIKIAGILSLAYTAFLLTNDVQGDLLGIS